MKDSRRSASSSTGSAPVKAATRPHASTRSAQQIGAAHTSSSSAIAHPVTTKKAATRTKTADALALSAAPKKATNGVAKTKTKSVPTKQSETITFSTTRPAKPRAKAKDGAAAKQGEAKKVASTAKIVTDSKAAPPNRDRESLAGARGETAQKKAAASLFAPTKSKTSHAAPHSAANQNGVSPNGVVVKAKRAKLPADFADQYARDTRKKATPVVVAPPKKRARRKAADRENLRRAMAPDDDLLQRLARAGAIGGGGETTPLRLPTAKRRSRKWESRCGKCGTNSTFSTPASLCARCGTIVVRCD